MPTVNESTDPARAALRQASIELDAASVGCQPFTMAQALSRFARCYRALGELEAAGAAYAQALRWSRLIGTIDMTVDLLCDACETAAARSEQLDDTEPEGGRGNAARERARKHAVEASKLAGAVADSRWEICVLLRISDVLDRFGDREDATALQCRALKLMNDEAAAQPRLPALRGARAG